MGASLVTNSFPGMAEGIWTGPGPSGYVAVSSHFSLNLFLLGAMAMTVRAVDRTAAQVTDTSVPRRAWLVAAPHLPVPPAMLHTRSGPCVCWCVGEKEGWWVNLKFNLLSFSHREKEWEQVSKNSLACQNW